VRRRAVSRRPQTTSPLLGLAPGGGYLAICITANAGGLLHHLFTITAPEGRLFVSVALFRQVRASRRLPRPGCYPTPCSMECGLSSIPTTQDRDCPTSLSHLHHTRCVGESQPFELSSLRETLEKAFCRGFFVFSAVKSLKGWTFQEKTLK
jgi:hypothetical protein